MATVFVILSKNALITQKAVRLTAWEVLVNAHVFTLTLATIALCKLVQRTLSYLRATQRIHSQIHQRKSKNSEQSTQAWVSLSQMCKFQIPTVTHRQLGPLKVMLCQQQTW
jgi:hypothetical protein